MSDESEFEPYAHGNALLDALPPAVLERFASQLRVVEQDDASVCIRRDDTLDMLHFPIDAIFSTIVVLDDGDAFEVDLVGREGMVGAEAALGAKVAARTIVCQQAGRVACLARRYFARMMDTSSEFRHAILQSVRLQWFVSQQTVACNNVHADAERAARWILMSSDAVGRARFRLRPEYASLMLGMSKDAVSLPISTLVSHGVIRYESETITILSREELMKSSCECYARQTSLRDGEPR